MYERFGQIDKETRKALINLANSGTWKTVKGSGRDYLTCFVTDEVKDFFDWQEWHSAFFLKIPPGGEVHRHTDVEHPWNTYHVVVCTNDDCISFSSGNPYHLEVGDIYSIDRSIEHYSVNKGKTDRIHLLAEVYD